jgi:hypothetical protein
VRAKINFAADAGGQRFAERLEAKKARIYPTPVHAFLPDLWTR